MSDEGSKPGWTEELSKARRGYWEWAQFESLYGAGSYKPASVYVAALERLVGSLGAGPKEVQRPALANDIVNDVRNRAGALGISPAEVLHDVLKEIEREDKEMAGG